MGLFIVAVILLLAGIGMLIFGAGVHDVDARPIIKASGFVALALGVIFGACSVIRTVPTGHTGVVTSFGNVEEYTFEAGIHFVAPWKKVIKMDNRIQTVTYELGAFSSDIQEVQVTYKVNYQIDKSNAQQIYRNIGTDYKDTVLVARVQEAVKNVVAKYTAETLIGNRDKLSTEIESTLISDAAKYNINIVTTAIANIDFTDAFTNAVEAKQVAEQNKLRAKTEQEQKIIEAEASAEQTKISAQATADAQIIAAEADAKVAKIGADAAEYQGQRDAAVMNNLGEMLTKYPNLLQYYYTTNWDGKLPETYMGSEEVSTLFQLNQ